MKAKDAEEAIKSLNGDWLDDDKNMKVSYAQSANYKDANLYVSFLDNGISKTDFERIFLPFGKILLSSQLQLYSFIKKRMSKWV